MVKTITITEEAYERVKAQKMPDESFSELFTRRFPRQLKLRDIMGALSSGNTELDTKEAQEWRDRIKKMKDDDKKLEEKRHVFLRQLSTH